MTDLVPAYRIVFHWSDDETCCTAQAHRRTDDHLLVQVAVEVPNGAVEVVAKTDRNRVEKSLAEQLEALLALRGVGGEPRQLRGA